MYKETDTLLVLTWKTPRRAQFIRCLESKRPDREYHLTRASWARLERVLQDYEKGRRAIGSTTKSGRSALIL